MDILLGIIVAIITCVVIITTKNVIKQIYMTRIVRKDATVEKALVIDKKENDNFLLLYTECKVYVMYEGEMYCIEDEDLYDEVNIGDIIDVTVFREYDSSDRLRRISLDIVFDE